LVANFALSFYHGRTGLDHLSVFAADNALGSEFILKAKEGDKGGKSYGNG
jgi:hypothetical protein